MMRVPRVWKLLLLAVCLALLGVYLSASFIRPYRVYRQTPEDFQSIGRPAREFRRLLPGRIPDWQSHGGGIEVLSEGRVARDYAGSDDMFEETPLFKPPPVGLDTKAVILFSYMRSGSSFLGDVLFNMDNSVFYAFEPLAAFYASMYGLEVSSVIDTDIIFWPNGTVRTFPPEETEAITWMLSNLLTCNVTSFPLEMYGHHFWSWPRRLYRYAGCVEDRSLLENTKSCHGYIEPLCGNHFADKSAADTTRCFQSLWQPFWKKVNQLEDEIHEPILSLKDQGKLRQYRNCLDSLSDAVQTCQPQLQHICRFSKVRATKIVRGSMASLEDLMKRMPNLQIIHLFRDPRGVVRSRKAIDWSQGHYDGTNLTRLAETYCRRVTMDTQQRKTMQAKYPNRILEVLYDEVVDDPFLNVERIYRFLKIPVPTGLGSMLDISRQTSRDFTGKWWYELSDTEIATIEQTCEEFAKETGFDWDRFGVPPDVKNRLLSEDWSVRL